MVYYFSRIDHGACRYNCDLLVNADLLPSDSEKTPWFSRLSE